MSPPQLARLLTEIPTDEKRATTTRSLRFAKSEHFRCRLGALDG